MAQKFSDAFYHSARWRNVRREVLRREHYTCALCAGRAQEIHHIIALTPENINDPKIALNPENLIALCRACHQKETKGSSDIVEGYAFDDEGQVIRR